METTHWGRSAHPWVQANSRHFSVVQISGWQLLLPSQGIVRSPPFSQSPKRFQAISLPSHMSSCHPAVYRALTVTSSVASRLSHKAETVTLTAQVREQAGRVQCTPRLIVPEGARRGQAPFSRHCHWPRHQSEPSSPRLGFAEEGRKLGSGGPRGTSLETLILFMVLRLFPRGAGMGR